MAKAQPKQLQADLAKLDTLAYDRRAYSEDDLIRYHALLSKKGKKALALIDSLYRWMLIPVTLWPINIQPVFQTCLDIIGKGKSLDKEMLHLLSLLPDPPSEEVCQVFSEHEFLVWKGGYESLVNKQAKFASLQKDAELNPEIQKEWKEIKTQWDVTKFADHKGIIRRSLTGERNLRERFWVDWKNPSDRFQATFNLFCNRWNLYGMERDKPLVMKLSVNLTAFGTMIFIPAYWSLDAKRDIRWDEVMKLQRSRALKKQGESLAESHEERRAWAVKLRKLDTEAKRLKLKGEKLDMFICKELGWVVVTDSKKRAARLRKEFPLG